MGARLGIMRVGRIAPVIQLRNSLVKQHHQFVVKLSLIFDQIQVVGVKTKRHLKLSRSLVEPSLNPIKAVQNEHSMATKHACRDRERRNQHANWGDGVGIHIPCT